MSLAVAGLVVGAAGVVQGFVGSRKAASAAKKAGREQASVIREQAAREALLQKYQTSALVGTQRAAFAARGVRVDLGSPLLVQAESLRRAQDDRAWILQSGESRARAAERGAGAMAEGIRTQGLAQMLSGTASLLSAYGGGGR